MIMLILRSSRWPFHLPYEHLARAELGPQSRILRLLVLLLERHELERTRENQTSGLRTQQYHQRRAMDQSRELRQLHQEIRNTTLQRSSNQQFSLLQHTKPNLLERHNKQRTTLIPLHNMYRIRPLPSRPQEHTITNRQPSPKRIHPAMVRLGLPTRQIQLHPLISRP